MVIPHLDFHCPVMNHLAEYHAHMRKNWIFFSSTDVDFLQGFLLAACRHLSMVHVDRNYYAQLATQYKLRYVKSLRQSISAEAQPLSATAVTRALVLAFDELMLRDLPTAAKHLLGAVQMVQLAGGSQALGLSDLGHYILDSCVQRNRLSDWKPIVDGNNGFMKLEFAQYL